MPNPRLGLLLVTLAAVAWSTTGLFTRALPHDAATLLVWRGCFGALGLLGFMALSGGNHGLRGFARLGAPGLLYSAVSAAGMVCFITSLRYTSVAHNSVIYASVPFMAAGLAWLALRERPSRSAVVASGVALAGVGLMMGWGADGGLLGDVLAVVMTLGMALMLVIARRFPAIPTLPAACLSALISAAAAAPLSQGLAVPIADIPLLIAFGLVNSALGLTLFLVGSRHLPAIQSALVTSLDAPLAPLWVWLFFAEQASLTTVTGGGIVLAAVMGHIWYEARHPAPG
jgi:drug/metabolite transporter (DMT)-like permease